MVLKPLFTMCQYEYPLLVQPIGRFLRFIIHPCDPTFVICCLIWPCDMAVRITHLVSYSSSLSSHSVIKAYVWVGCIINTKLPSCVDIIRRTSLGFPAGALKALILRTRASRTPPVKTS